MNDIKSWNSLFLSDSNESIIAYQTAIKEALDIVIEYFALSKLAYSGLMPEELCLINDELFSDEGKSLSQVLQQIGETIIQHSANVSHPTCIAHLHCPTLIPSLAAELLISATNQSMDSWDQSPAATILEQKVINNLCRMYGYDCQADGIFTSGGTQSNFMGMLLARDRYAQDNLKWSIQQQGLPLESCRFRILCSEVAHFTISQSASLLGLGTQAVVTVKADSHYRLCLDDLEAKITLLYEQNLLPIAVVATVGTTDFGSIDPLPELAQFAQKYRLWLHIDAAYGGALILSNKYCHYLKGIEQADSLTVDFHKLFYQPISCGAFLLKNRDNFALMKLHADYLNPEDNEDLGFLDLVTKSVQTTRRFDALKLFISLQTLGKKAFGEMIDSTIELAQITANLININSNLELANYPTINSVVFRYVPQFNQKDIHISNTINRKIRLNLIKNGQAIIAQTQIKSLVYLKLTLLNPQTQIEHIRILLEEVQYLGKILEN